MKQIDISLGARKYSAKIPDDDRSYKIKARLDELINEDINTIKIDDFIKDYLALFYSYEQSKEENKLLTDKIQKLEEDINKIIEQLR